MESASRWTEQSHRLGRESKMRIYCLSRYELLPVQDRRIRKRNQKIAKGGWFNGDYEENQLLNTNGEGDKKTMSIETGELRSLAYYEGALMALKRDAAELVEIADRIIKRAQYVGSDVRQLSDLIERLKDGDTSLLPKTKND